MSEFEQINEAGVVEEAPVQAAPQGEFTRIIGLDVANSTLKIWTDELNLKYVNTIRQINDAGLVYSFKTDYQMYVYDKAVYEVGVVSAAGSGGRGISRYGSEQYKIEALIGIASCLKEIPNLSDHEVLRVVTGVPSSLAKNQKIITQIKQHHDMLEAQRLQAAMPENSRKK